MIDASRNPKAFRLALARVFPALLLATLSPMLAAASPTASSDEQAIVDCRLPPQLRTLGRHATYLAAGRQLRITAANCKVRGGSHDGRGPGMYAGQNAAAGRPRIDVVVVMVGGSSSPPACRPARVSGLKTQGSLAVRSGPGLAYTRMDRLGNGRRLELCDWSADGAWVGVVYPGPNGVDCRVSGTVDPAAPYSGPCLSGWVRANYVR